jgi:hypothetical protein
LHFSLPKLVADDAVGHINACAAEPPCGTRGIFEHDSGHDELGCAVDNSADLLRPRHRGLRAQPQTVRSGAERPRRM